MDSSRKRRRWEKEYARQSAILRISNRYVPHMWIPEFTWRCLHLSSPRQVSDYPGTNVVRPIVLIVREYAVPRARERRYVAEGDHAARQVLFTCSPCEPVRELYRREWKMSWVARGRKLVDAVSLSAKAAGGKTGKKLRAALNSHSKGVAPHGNSSRGAFETTSGVMSPGKRDRIKRSPSHPPCGGERVMQLLVRFNFFQPRPRPVCLEKRRRSDNEIIRAKLKKKTRFFVDYSYIPRARVCGPRIHL